MEELIKTWQVDRTRALEFQRCPRARWLGFHSNGGKGIQRKSKALPLLLGGAVHEGLAILLQKKGIQQAVLYSQFWLSNEFESRGFQLNGEDASDAATVYAAKEQAALTEALLRAWWSWEGESFHDRFEVLEVEQEGRAHLAPDVELLFRPDALIREKETGDLFVVSWKTTGMFGQRNIQQESMDMQSMSEVFGLQQVRDVKIEGVLYKHLVKGSRRKDDYRGMYVQDSHLIYAWKKLGAATAEDQEWAWRYGWTDEDGKNRVLGKGWKKVPVWEDYPGGVEAWIDALAKQEHQPRDIHPFDSVFPADLPVERRADEIEHWRVQVVSQERRVRQRVRAVEIDSRQLDAEFPQHTARCLDFSRCQFVDVCHTPAVGADPIASGLYMPRIQNHPEKGDDDES